jgi:hypothetical protein
MYNLRPALKLFGIHSLLFKGFSGNSLHDLFLLKIFPGTEIFRKNPFCFKFTEKSK